MITLFNELRKHGRLAMKRHPMFERSKFARYLNYIMMAFWAGYLIFIGIGMSRGLDSIPNRDAYQILNGGGLVLILAIDFLMRMPFQKAPSQEVKPYLLLPVKRQRLIDFLLLRSGLDGFNLFWMFFFVPFATLAIFKFFGIGGMLAYLIGIWLLLLANNYWFLLCRTLFGESLWWVVMPILFYAGIGGLMFLPGHYLFYFFMDLGDGYIHANPLWFLGTILLIAGLWLVNRRVIGRLIYAELAKTDDIRIKHISNYRFFERYGEVGEYMRLELKMLLRNRRCKTLLRSSILMIVAFTFALSFTKAYDKKFMNTFVCVYNFVVYGMMFLSQLMSFEGNYIDGLMVRKESVMSLLKAKYYFYSIGEIIPFVLMIPAVLTGKLPLLGAFAWCFYTIGFIYFCFFQLAVYNKQTLTLNEKVTARQTNTGLQMLINFSSFLLPIILFHVLTLFLDDTATYIILLLIGLGFVLTSHLWLANVYKRFMQRRYTNMEGFRDSRK
jgi:hypothetical protein